MSMLCFTLYCPLEEVHMAKIFTLEFVLSQYANNLVITQLLIAFETVIKYKNTTKNL